MDQRRHVGHSRPRRMARPLPGDGSVTPVRRARARLVGLAAAALAATVAVADPCGMVPPPWTGTGPPIARVGAQRTYVFFRDGIESLTIRPEFEGRADEFGMLIPFPSPPSVTKAPDDVFEQIQSAVDPPAYVVPPLPRGPASGGLIRSEIAGLRFDTVEVLRQEAVGIYDVAVLQAGSAQALERWMTQHGYRYPEGMGGVAQEYVEQGWCFVAVKTRVGQMPGIEPRPGMRDVETELPAGSTFRGAVQAMTFRFRVDAAVVPMRLSAFNDGPLRNQVYVLAERPVCFAELDQGLVVRQLPGTELVRNLTGPLDVLWPADGAPGELPASWAVARRDPRPSNAGARDLFLADLVSACAGELTPPWDASEDELVEVGFRLGMTNEHVDALHREAVRASHAEELEERLDDLAEMTLTVLDGDFPRGVLRLKNLTLAHFELPAERNRREVYDARHGGPPPEREGALVSPAGQRYRLPGRPDEPDRANEVERRIAELLGFEPDAPRRDVAAVLEAREHRELASLLPLARDAGLAGWAVVALRDARRADLLGELTRDTRTPEMTRVWAAGAAIPLAAEAEELVGLLRAAGSHPALGEPLGRRVVASADAGDEGVWSELHELRMFGFGAFADDALRREIHDTIGHERLLARAFSTEDGGEQFALNRELARLGGERPRVVAGAYLEHLRFDADADDPPWGRGALFLPGLPWSGEELDALRAVFGAWRGWALERERRDVVDRIDRLLSQPPF